MDTNSQHFSIDELATLVDLPRRTVRYYIQEGLVDRPHGAKRGAYYTREHLAQLLSIRKWQRAGLGLERIRELMAGEGAEGDVPPVPPPKPGDVTVCSHVALGAGVELVIDPQRAGLSPEQVRTLARETAALVARIQKEMGP